MSISEFAIGAIRWINGQIKSSIEKELYTLDLETTQGQETFCITTGLSAEEVTALQNKHNEVGTRPIYYTDKSADFGADSRWTIFRRLTPAWNEISTTVGSGPRDEERRYTRGMTASSTSCALDVVVQLAIYMNLGRIQRDVVRLRTIETFSTPTRLLLQALLGPWGELSQNQRDRAGLIIRKSISAHDPNKFPDRQWWSVQAVIDVLLKGPPQTTWTHIKTQTCCDSQPTLHPGARPQTACSIFILVPDDSLTLGARINEFFSTQRTMDSVSVCCSRGTSCTLTPTKRLRVILDDCLPPRLIVHLATDIIWQQDERLHPFEDIQVTAWGLDTTKLVAQYQAIAGIFVVNNNHFVLRWKVRQDTDGAESMIRHFDSGKTTYVKTWWSDYQQTARRAQELDLERRTQQIARLPRIVTIVFEIKMCS